MARYTLNEFIEGTAQEDKGEGLFEMENKRLLEINLDGMVWIKIGSMVAYTGNIKFVREGMLEHGVDKLFKKALTGEGVHLAKATGAGKLYVADGAKRVSIINLQNEAIYVNGNDVLAFETGVHYDIKMMRRGIFDAHRRPVQRETGRHGYGCDHQFRGASHPARDAG